MASNLTSRLVDTTTLAQDSPAGDKSTNPITEAEWKIPLSSAKKEITARSVNDVTIELAETEKETRQAVRALENAVDTINSGSTASSQLVSALSAKVNTLDSQVTDNKQLAEGNKEAFNSLITYTDFNPSPVTPLVKGDIVKGSDNHYYYLVDPTKGTTDPVNDPTGWERVSVKETIKDLDELKVKVANQKLVTDANAQGIVDLGTEKDVIKLDIVDLKAHNANQDAEITNLVTTVGGVQTEIDDLKTADTALNTELSVLAGELNNLSKGDKPAHYEFEPNKLHKAGRVYEIIADGSLWKCDVDNSDADTTDKIHWTEHEHRDIKDLQTHVTSLMNAPAFTTTPTVPYVIGEVVVGSDGALYKLTDLTQGATDPAVATSGWTKLSLSDLDKQVQELKDSTSTFIYSKGGKVGKYYRKDNKLYLCIQDSTIDNLLDTNFFTEISSESKNIITTDANGNIKIQGLAGMTIAKLTGETKPQASDRLNVNQADLQDLIDKWKVAQSSTNLPANCLEFVRPHSAPSTSMLAVKKYITLADLGTTDINVIATMLGLSATDKAKLSISSGLPVIETLTDVTLVVKKKYTSDGVSRDNPIQESEIDASITAFLTEWNKGTAVRTEIVRKYKDTANRPRYATWGIAYTPLRYLGVNADGCIRNVTSATKDYGTSPADWHNFKVDRDGAYKTKIGDSRSLIGIDQKDETEAGVRTRLGLQTTDTVTSSGSNWVITAKPVAESQSIAQGRYEAIHGALQTGDTITLHGNDWVVNLSIHEEDKPTASARLHIPQSALSDSKAGFWTVCDLKGVTIPTSSDTDSIAKVSAYLGINEKDITAVTGGFLIASSTTNFGSLTQTPLKPIDDLIAQGTVGQFVTLDSNHKIALRFADFMFYLTEYKDPIKLRTNNSYYCYLEPYSNLTEEETFDEVKKILSVAKNVRFLLQNSRATKMLTKGDNFKIVINKDKTGGTNTDVIELDKLSVYKTMTHEVGDFIEVISKSYINSSNTSNIEIIM